MLIYVTINKHSRVKHNESAGNFSCTKDETRNL